MHQDNGSKSVGVSRRQFLQGASGAAAGSVLVTLPQVAGAQEDAAPAVRSGLTRYAATGGNITLTVNDRPAQITVTPDTTLLQAVRESLNLTGAKEVCDRGACGACTVIIESRTYYSCSMLAIEAQGRNIRTVDGLAKGNALHPVQQAFCDHDGLMCGFCTPGFVMATVALLEKTPNPTPEQAKKALDGNLCRCGTNIGVLKAALAAKGVSRG